jgi:DNA polymerase-3 subunit alpha
MEVLPLFKSHYSIGRSILTLEDEEDFSENPDSIITICKKFNIKNLYLVEDNMSSFLQAYNTTNNNNINLRYGLRITVTENIEDKTDQSRNKNCKFVIFFKNENGYRRMLKIFSTAAKEGFYYEPRIDYKTLKANWDEKDLMLCVPFYDSFIYNNVLRGYLCTPELNFTKPIFLLEDNDMPFDKLITEKIKEYINHTKDSFLKVKSIFYKNKADFKAYLTFRCINIRTTLNKPELEHMSSNEFCLESWMENNKNG